MFTSLIVELEILLDWTSSKLLDGFCCPIRKSCCASYRQTLGSRIFKLERVLVAAEKPKTP